MEFITQFFQALKSPKTATVLFLFTGALLFAPLEKAGLEKPEFTSDYQTQILLVFLLASAILTLEISIVLFHLVRRFITAPFRAKAQRKHWREVFVSLNLQELCVLWVMTQSGMKSIKGDYSKTVMISLRQKGALGLMGGTYASHEAHHFMPDPLYEIVAKEGYERFPDDFKNSPRFEDEVKKIHHNSTNWRTW